MKASKVTTTAGSDSAGIAWEALSNEDLLKVVESTRGGNFVERMDGPNSDHDVNTNISLWSAAFRR